MISSQLGDFTSVVIYVNVIIIEDRGTEGKNKNRNERG